VINILFRKVFSAQFLPKHLYEKAIKISFVAHGIAKVYPGLCIRQEKKTRWQ
jgi:hypothetical protein